MHSNSLDHYLSAIRTRHLREGFPDPCTGPHQRDLARAFRREDDARGVLQDVRAALPAEVVARIRHYGLLQAAGSLEERDAALIVFQYLLGWREASSRTLLLQDVVVTTVGSSSDIHSAREGSFQLSARPRTLKGRPVRGAPAIQLTCCSTQAGNPLALQHRYYSSVRKQSSSSFYWSHAGETPGPQAVSHALQQVLAALSIVAPPFCFYSPHSLRSGSVTAQVRMGVPLPVIVQRGSWTTARMVLNVYFEGRIPLSPEIEQYFWSLVPRSQLPLPQ